MSFYNLGQHSAVVYPADAPRHPAVLTECILQHKANHTNLYFTSLWHTCQIGIRLPVCFLAIIIICVYNEKWAVNHISAAQDSLSRSPRLCPVRKFFSEFRRDIFHFLICIRYFCYLLDPSSDHLSEIFLQISSDHKDHFIKPCLQCIIDRIVHNDLSAGSYRLQLFDSRTKTAAQPGRHDH